jgi:hypothetical protein
VFWTQIIFILVQNTKKNRVLDEDKSKKTLLLSEIQWFEQIFVLYNIQLCAADNEAHLGADWNFVFVG